MILDPARQQPPAAAATIIWQTKIRVVIAAVVGAASLLLSGSGASAGSPRLVLAAGAAYLALVGAMDLGARRGRDTMPAAAVGLIVADLLFVFTTTILGSTPAHYDRSLIVAFVVLQLADDVLGRVYTYLVSGAVAAGYLALVGVSIRRGAPLDWGQELWSAGVFALAGAIFAQRSGALSGRVRKIVALFERAEEGDFSQEYDVRADRRPDAITAVGHAYNRVRARLESMVLTDPLTGCLNRRGFDQALTREIARSWRAGSEFSLVAIDLDHFKRLNDRCGHHAGDAILRELGTLLRQAARAGDTVARTGGEEFTLILPDTSAAGGFQVATRLTERIRGRDFVVNGKALRITVSAGVAAASAGAIDRQGHELKVRADQALYAAKRLGRDRVLTWNE